LHDAFETEEWRDVMSRMIDNKRRTLQRTLWFNIGVIMLLLIGAALGITQAFILLAIFALVILPS